jgi:hypothetical protein
MTYSNPLKAQRQAAIIVKLMAILDAIVKIKRTEKAITMGTGTIFKFVLAVLFIGSLIELYVQTPLILSYPASHRSRQVFFIITFDGEHLSTQKIPPEITSSNSGTKQEVQIVKLVQVLQLAKQSLHDLNPFEMIS